MSKYNLVNQKFDKLLVIEKTDVRISKKVFWKCLCDCGNIKYVQTYHLTKGIIQSCGCSSTKYKQTEFTKPLYIIWQGMKNRCYNPKHENYVNYNGKGISICDEWKDDFELFYNWSISNGYKKGLSIDRINNNGNYEPSNCRWVTKREQMWNTSKNKIIEYKNETRCMAEWCDILNLNYETIQSRFHRGWNVEKTFETPIRKINKKSNKAPIE